MSKSKKRVAEKGEKGTCFHCSAEITRKGDYWVDSENSTRCPKSYIHSVSGVNWMPQRVMVPIA